MLITRSPTLARLRPLAPSTRNAPNARLVRPTAAPPGLFSVANGNPSPLVFVRPICTSTLPVNTVPAKLGLRQRLNDGLGDGDAVRLADPDELGELVEVGEVD